MKAIVKIPSNHTGGAMSNWKFQDELSEVESLSVVFSLVEDPRIERTKLYPLPEVLFLALAAVVSGIEGWRHIEEFGKDRIELLRRYFPYQEGIPCFQTIARIFSIIPSSNFELLFMKFMSWATRSSDQELIAIDGKTLRRSFDKSSGKESLHILNAWAVNRGICLGQIEVGEKTNEITAVPEILDMLDITGAIITVDALNAQKEIAAKIIEKKADYVMPIKGNQSCLKKDIEDFFNLELLALQPSFQHEKSIEKGHGRIETRDVYCVKNVSLLHNQHHWPKLNSISKIVSRVVRNGIETQTTRYFISSLPADAQKIGRFVRGHWGVENNLHWVLDVCFDEDHSRKRKDHAPRNFSLLRKIAINLIKEDKKSGWSIKYRRYKAATNDLYFGMLFGNAGFLQTI